MCVAVRGRGVSLQLSFFNVVRIFLCVERRRQGRAVYKNSQLKVKSPGETKALMNFFRVRIFDKQKGEWLNTQSLRGDQLKCFTYRLLSTRVRMAWCVRACKSQEVESSCIIGSSNPSQRKEEKKRWDGKKVVMEQ